MIPQNEERDRETLAMQKGDSNSNNYWSFIYSWKSFRIWIRKKYMKNYCNLIQKAFLLGTAKIIRKVLDT